MPQWKTCHLCDLCKSRTNVVFPRGRIAGSDSPRLFFIGEAPGNDEDRLGTAFIGRSGKVLDSLISLIDGDIGSKVSYKIGNTVSCRPPGNRAPTESEILSCLPKILSEIATFNPDLVVALGKVASDWCKRNIALLKGFTGSRGFTHRESDDGIPWLAIYHPAFLLRKGNSFMSQYLMKSSSQIVNTLKEILEYAQN